MKRLYAQLSDNSTVNIPADRMVMDENMVYIYDGTVLVALMDVSVILHAHFSEKKNDRSYTEYNYCPQLRCKDGWRE